MTSGTPNQQRALAVEDDEEIRIFAAACLSLCGDQVQRGGRPTNSWGG